MISNVNSKIKNIFKKKLIYLKILIIFFKSGRKSEGIKNKTLRDSRALYKTNKNY